MSAHPFPASLVTNPNDDPRLGCTYMNMLEPFLLVVSDFAVTKLGVWGVYEILPFNQGQPGFGFYRAFTSVKRLVTRKSPDKFENLAVVYDRKAGTLSWKVNGKTEFVVDKIGFLPTDPEAVVIIDHGGIERLVEPQSFLVGWGGIELLDGTDPNDPASQQGLVKLVNDTILPGFYQKPTSFFDPLSKFESRRFGQGTISEVRKLQVRVKS